LVTLLSEKKRKGQIKNRTLSIANRFGTSTIRRIWIGMEETNPKNETTAFGISPSTFEIQGIER
jgi:hypothetical protein